MTSRERVLCALRCEAPDRVPRTMGWSSAAARCFPSEEAFRRHFGIDVRQVAIEPSGVQKEFRAYLETLPPEVRVGDLPTLKLYAAWGYCPPGVGGDAEQNPLGDVCSAEEIATYAFPEMALDTRFQKLEAEVRRCHQEGLAVLGRSYRLGGHVFEMAQRLRGLERLSFDLADNPALVDYLLDAIADVGCQNAALLARAGVDILYLNDDIGTPTSMLLDPALWRRTIQPRLFRMIRAARAVAPDIRVLYHSDGWFEPVIPDLIEIGVNAIEPVQPDCMDPGVLKRRYGDRLAFWGTVGTPARWAWAPPEAIHEEVRSRIEGLGQGGGLILAPAYGIEPDTPWENILAFFEAAERHGRYSDAPKAER